MCMPVSVFILCVRVFGMCIMCVQCPVGQKMAADYLKLEIKMVVSHIVGAAGNWAPDPLEEVPVLLTAEPFLQPVGQFISQYKTKSVVRL